MGFDYISSDYCLSFYFSKMSRDKASVVCTITQMAHFSFSYYFTIPNSEFRNLHYEFREFGIRNCEVYVIWTSGTRVSTLEGILNLQTKTKGSTT